MTVFVSITSIEAALLSRSNIGEPSFIYAMPISIYLIIKGLRDAKSRTYVPLFFPKRILIVVPRIIYDSILNRYLMTLSFTCELPLNNLGIDIDWYVNELRK